MSAAFLRHVCEAWHKRPHPSGFPAGTHHSSIPASGRCGTAPLCWCARRSGRLPHPGYLPGGARHRSQGFRRIQTAWHCTTQPTPAPPSVGSPYIGPAAPSSAKTEAHTHPHADAAPTRLWPPAYHSHIGKAAFPPALSHDSDKATFPDSTKSPSLFQGILAGLCTHINPPQARASA